MRRSRYFNQFTCLCFYFKSFTKYSTYANICAFACSSLYAYFISKVQQKKNVSVVREHSFFIVPLLRRNICLIFSVVDVKGEDGPITKKFCENLLEKSTKYNNTKLKAPSKQVEGNQYTAPSAHSIYLLIN